MKNIIILLLAAITIGSSVDVHAQGPTKYKKYTAAVKRDNTGTVVSTDTLTDGDNGTIGHPVTYAYDLTFNFKATRLSGTLAGYATLIGTSDSTNGPWYPIKGNRTQCNTCVDSLATFTDAATNTFTWMVPRSPFLYYKVLYYTTGTVTAITSLVTDYKY
jgi:hypothetical protein